MTVWSIWWIERCCCPRWLTVDIHLFISRRLVRDRTHDIYVAKAVMYQLSLKMKIAHFYLSTIEFRFMPRKYIFACKRSVLHELNAWWWVALITAPLLSDPVTWWVASCVGGTTQWSTYSLLHRKRAFWVHASTHVSECMCFCVYLLKAAPNVPR